MLLVPSLKSLIGFYVLDSYVKWLHLRTKKRQQRFLSGAMRTLSFYVKCIFNLSTFMVVHDISGRKFK